jgi:hypothetical protein
MFSFVLELCSKQISIACTLQVKPQPVLDIARSFQDHNLIFKLRISTLNNHSIVHLLEQSAIFAQLQISGAGYTSGFGRI